MLVLLLFPSPLETDATRALPDFVDLDLGQSNTENISLDDVKALQTLYREHCEVRGSSRPLQLLSVWRKHHQAHLCS